MSLFRFVALMPLLVIVACNSGDQKPGEQDSTARRSATLITSPAPIDSSAQISTAAVVSGDGRPEEPDPEAGMAIDTSDDIIPELASTNGNIVLETFGVPDAFNGCKLTTAASEKDLQKSTNVFVASVGGQDLACIRIKGVNVFLRGDHAHPIVDDETQYYKGHGYKVSLQQTGKKYTNEETESWKFDGVIEITYAGKTVKLKVKGAAGC